MSTSPSRGRNRSPRRSQDLSSSRNSSRRRALHERSDSQTNEQRLPALLDSKPVLYSRDNGDDIYDRNPFPTLPSHVLRPSGGFSIFEDQTATSLQQPQQPKPNSQQQARHETAVGQPRPERTRSQKGKSKRRPSPDRVSTSDGQPSAESSSAMYSSPASPSLVSLRRQQLEALESAVKRAERVRAEQLASRASMKPLPPSSHGKINEARDRAFLAKYQSLVLSRFSPGDRFSLQQDHGEAFQRPRSRSSVHTLSRPNSSYTVRQSEDRPRSASQPPPAPVEGDLSAMLSEGIEVQYAKITQPSMTSLRSESSSVVRAYPAPLRLKRKRAEDQLARTASQQQAAIALHHQLSDASLASPRSAQSLDPSDENFGLHFSDTTDMDLTLTLPQRAHTSTAYTDELDDTLGELNAPALRFQRSGFFSDKSTVPSRPDSILSFASHTSNNSQATHRQFFTHFLNDSKTTWAKSYYGGKAGIRLEAPSVVNLSSAKRPSTPAMSAEPNPASWETFSSLSGSSPNSSEYASQIYIPRIRAMAGAESSQNAPSETADNAHSFSFATGDTPSLHNASEGMLQQARQFDAASGAYLSPVHHSPAAFDPLNMPATPRLWQDKGLGFSMYSLRSPSLDRYERPWGPVNRQYWLLLTGFFVPLAWMIAAFLPIPARPTWRQGSNASRLEDSDIEALDFWNTQEVKRYTKARRWRVYNRFMSLFGLCVIAIVIAFAIIGARA